MRTRRYKSFTSATIRLPWAISAPISHFGRSAFTASMAALVSCRRASMSALVARLPLSRATCSSAGVSACFSVKPLSVSHLTKRWVSNAMASDMRRS